MTESLHSVALEALLLALDAGDSASASAIEALGSDPAGLGELFGSSSGESAVLSAAWKEDEHPRDGGKFAKKGEEGQGQGQGQEQPAQPDPALTSPRSLLSRIHQVPQQLKDKAKAFIAAKYEKLSARYGKKGAAAILTAMVLLTPIPAPGTSLLPIAIAEGVRAIGGLLGRSSGQQLAEAGDSDILSLEELANESGLSVEELVREARAALAESD